MLSFKKETNRNTLVWQFTVSGNPSKNASLTNSTTYKNHTLARRRFSFIKVENRLTITINCKMSVNPNSVKLIKNKTK